MPWTAFGGIRWPLGTQQHFIASSNFDQIQYAWKFCSRLWLFCDSGPADLFVLNCYFVIGMLLYDVIIWGVCLAAGGKFHICVVWLLCYYISYYRFDGIPLGHILYEKISLPLDEWLFSNWLRGIKGKDTHCVSFPVCERAIFHPRRQMERRCVHSGERHYISCAKKLHVLLPFGEMEICAPSRYHVEIFLCVFLKHTTTSIRNYFCNRTLAKF